MRRHILTLAAGLVLLLSGGLTAVLAAEGEPTVETATFTNVVTYTIPTVTETVTQPPVTVTVTAPPPTTAPPPPTTEPPPPTTAPPPPSSALQPGASLSAAYTAAACGAVFELASGSWPAQTISGNKTCATDSYITFKEAPGARAIISQIVVEADHVRLVGLETAYTQVGNRLNQNRVWIGPGSSWVMLEDVDAGSFGTWQTNHVRVIGGDYGPCHAHTSSNVCHTNYVDVSDDTVIDGATIHDFGYTSACVQAANCHWRALYMNGVNGLVLRNTVIRDSVFAPWFTLSGSEAGARGNSNILIENNSFGVQTSSGTDYWADGWGFQAAWCQNGAQPSYRNVVIRHNSYARGATHSLPGSPDGGEDGCRTTGFQVYGNIVNQSPYTCGSAASGITNSYNVYTGRYSFACAGTGNVNIGSMTHPFYVDDDQGPERGDYDLDQDFAGVNRVPAAMCPPVDASGALRNVADGFCDAGAYELG